MTMNRSIPIIPLFGYTRDEKEAVELSQKEIIRSGYKFAVLNFDDGFSLSMYNMSRHEQQNVIDRVLSLYNLVLSEG